MTRRIFLADRTVGRLARWLRLVGYDCVWDPMADQKRLLERAVAEGRILLTRDTLLVQRRQVARGEVAAILVRHDLPSDQLEQLRDELGLCRQPGPRCLVCNSELEEVSLEQVRDRVPPYVAATQTQFTYCGVCDRVTWPATHWEDMECRLAALGF
jgi:uncharacterized protein